MVQLADVIRQVEELTPADRASLRAHLSRSDPAWAQIVDDLRAAGIEVTAPRDAAGRLPPFEPVAARGKGVSQTIIEERR